MLWNLTMVGESITLGNVDDFPRGEGVRVVVNEIPIPLAVFNTSDGFFAVTDSCPHKQAPLSRAGTTPRTSKIGGTRGKLNVEEKTVSCPWHGLEFDLETGECPATNYRIGSFDIVVQEGNVILNI